MNKRLVSGSILFLVVLFAISLAWDNHLHVEEDLKRPNDFGCETRNSRFICIMGILRRNFPIAKNKFAQEWDSAYNQKANG